MTDLRTASEKQEEEVRDNVARHKETIQQVRLEFFVVDVLIVLICFWNEMNFTFF